MTERWKKWMPVKGLPPKMYNNLLVDGEEGVILNFSDENDTKRIIVKFDGNVLSYRNTDEGLLMKMLIFLDENYGSSFYGNWSIFKAANTAYINWFLEESSGIYKPDEIHHYIFLTPHDVIEVLSTDIPSIRVENI